MQLAKRLLLVVLAAVGTSVPVGAQAPGSEAKVNVATIASAEKLLGLELSGPERAQALAELRRRERRPAFGP